MMVKNQRYDNNQDGKEAKDQTRDQIMIQNIIEMFGRGEISLSEMWKQIEDQISNTCLRQEFANPINIPEGIFPAEKVG